MGNLNCTNSSSFLPMVGWRLRWRRTQQLTWRWCVCEADLYDTNTNKDQPSDLKHMISGDHDANEESSLRKNMSLCL